MDVDPKLRCPGCIDEIREKCENERTVLQVRLGQVGVMNHDPRPMHQIAAELVVASVQALNTIGCELPTGSG